MIQNENYTHFWYLTENNFNPHYVTKAIELHLPDNMYWNVL